MNKFAQLTPNAGTGIKIENYNNKNYLHYNKRQSSCYESYHHPGKTMNISNTG